MTFPRSAALYALIPFTCALLLVLAAAAHAVLRQRRGLPLSCGMVAWPAPFAIALAAFGALCAGGLYVDGYLANVAFSVCGLLAGLSTLARTHINGWIEKRLDDTDTRANLAAGAFRTARDIAILALCSVLSASAIELAWNEAGGQIPVLFFWTSALIAFVPMLILWLLGQRTGILACLIPLAFAGLGTAQHFILAFKGTAIMPADLLALGTAAAVADSYTYTLTFRIVYAFAIALICLALLSFVSPIRARTPRLRWTRVAANLILGAAVCSVAAGAFAANDLEDVLAFSYDRWMPIDSYRTYGFATCFAAEIQDMKIDEPEGYEESAAERLQAKLVAQYDETLGATPERQAACAQFDEIRPTVIGVMNESFSDLSIYEPLRQAGYTGPAYYNSIPDAAMRGALEVSVSGGGTANSEFEFLSNNTGAFFGTIYPYQVYNLADVDALPKQFASMGYGTHAMHPNLATNWNRSDAYEELGFEEFLDIDDFPGAPAYHAGVTDRATYDKILELLAQDDSPQFIFDVTMQNHGGYGPGTVPEQDLVTYPVPNLSEQQNQEVGTYLACAAASDRDLAYLIGELEKIDRPVVLVFFGDHQPSVGSTLNDALYPGEDDLAHGMRQFESTYLVWANYDIAGSSGQTQVRPLGSNTLSAHVLHLIGAPLSDYQKALMVLDQNVRAIGAAGYIGADGASYDLEAKSAYAEALRRIQQLQYLNFVEKVR